jgi:hypothetical protein
MNPYLQQSLAPQLALLNQQQALGARDIAGKSVGQGAFGGNRATLAQGLNAQNYALAGQQAIGQGYNEAFKQAQQAQQFRSDLGLRGLATGIQGAETGLRGVQGAQQGYTGATQAGVGLGNIGAQQSQSDLARIALMNQMANQRYLQPYQNIEFQRNMLSGLPVSSSTTQGYQAPPNTLSQIGGMATTLLGAYGLANKSGLIDKGINTVKNWWDSPSSTNYFSSNPTYSDNPAGTSSYGEQNEYNAEGGAIKEKRYASGGLVTLAINNALKG